MASPQSSAAPRIVEASQPFENVLAQELDALDGQTPSKQPLANALSDYDSADYWIEADDIADLQRLAEFLYDAGVKDKYGGYNINIGTDGPRLILRAKIWNALPEDLQRRIELIATRPKIIWERDASRAAEQVARALTYLIRGKEITDEIIAQQAVS
jgi:hypothetical protein